MASWLTFRGTSSVVRYWISLGYGAILSCGLDNACCLARGSVLGGMEAMSDILQFCDQLARLRHVGVAELTMRRQGRVHCVRACVGLQGC